MTRTLITSRGGEGLLDSVSRTLDEVLKLQDLNFRVLPVHSPRGARCSCGNPKCPSVGKHPRVKAWQSAATINAAEATKWWTSWPDANIGIATGGGLVVVDFDSEEAYERALTLGLPATVEVQTARGRHLYFSGTSGNRAALFTGIDVRGTNGMVLAPPSLHASGKRYGWVNYPGEWDFAPLPRWITSTPAKKTRKKTAPGKTAPGESALGALREGERNDGLAKRAGTMRSVGLTAQEIEAALTVTNAQRCVPPLAETEVQQIANSIGNRPAGRRIDHTLLSLRLGPYPTTIYLALRAHADHTGVIRGMSYERLAYLTDIGRSTVINAIKTLKTAGLIRSKPGGLVKPNVYTLLDPEEQSIAPALAAGTTQGQEHDD